MQIHDCTRGYTNAEQAPQKGHGLQLQYEKCVYVNQQNDIS